MNEKRYIAADLGASNGRTILGRFDGKRLKLEELNRFEVSYIRTGDNLYWDLLRIYSCVLDGLKGYAAKNTGEISGIGIDTWGVDFGLLDKTGNLVGNPRSYRDPRGRRGMEAFHKKYGERAAFDISGIANLEFNTLYQLYSMEEENDPQLEIADKLLLLPDLIGYMLCGVKSIEYTNATTTQMLNSSTGVWSEKVIQMAGLDSSLFAGIQMSGEVKGKMLDHVATDTGLKGRPPIICVGSHDTASAVASLPVETDNFAFISSGTWSLIGIISENAIISDDAYRNRFSNEGAVNGSYRPLRNIMGMWIIQNCKRQWDREESLSWDEIVDMAVSADAFSSFIDVNFNEFFDGDNMPDKIQDYCRKTGQRVPNTKGEIARSVYESLAMSYRNAFEGLERLKGGSIDVMHIVGGGARNKLLNQYTANALGRPVIAGPYEGTAIGNLLMQLKSDGELKGADDMRKLIIDSFETEVYEPEDTELWDEMYQRYSALSGI